MNFNPYLKSIHETYAQWWDCYTITDVVGKKRDEKKSRDNWRSAMLSPSPFFDFNLTVEKVKQKKEEETERLTVLAGLLKYANDHVLLIGRPGSGKSTALLRLLLESAEEAQSVIARGAERNDAIPRTSRIKQQIPILIELRFYQTSIIQLIRDFLKRHQLWLEIAEIEKLLFEGKFLLVFDGVNELPSEAARQDLTKFRQDYQQTTPMIFTTRDLGVGGDLGIEKKLQMQPLTETQMRDFVCGYLPEQGEELLKQLSGRLRELGETPLLLMMLCSVFVDNQNKVPSNLGSVFRRFTEIYDKQIKQDIPVTDESRFWWKRLLQHLAWVMTHGESKTEISVTIPIQEARDILTKFLKEQDYHQPRNAEKWLDDLLKHHLIQIGAENQIEFRHQLLQEYYAAERLLEELPKLSDDELQWEYLNYLKWTEPVALMLQLVDKQSQAVGLVKLALGIDWQLGARLAGEIKPQWQEKSVKLITDLNLPQLLEIRLLGITKSDLALHKLIEYLKQEYSLAKLEEMIKALGKFNSHTAFSILSKIAFNNLELEWNDARIIAIDVLGNIGSDSIITELIKIIKYQMYDEDNEIFESAAKTLGKIGSYSVINALIKAMQDVDYRVRINVAEAVNCIESPVLIKALVKVLKNNLEDEDIDVRCSALEALERINSEVLVNTELEFDFYEDDEDDEDDDFYFLNLDDIAAVKEAPIEYLTNLEKGSTCRAYAAEYLGIIGSEKLVYILVKYLKDKSELVRSHAAKALGNIGSYSAMDALIGILENDNEDEKVCIEAVLALGKIGSDVAVEPLIKNSEHKSFDVRVAVAKALFLLGSRATIPILIQALKVKHYDKAILTLEKTQEHLKYYKPIPKPTMSKSTSHNYALLIGVGECEETKLSLPVTVKDIQAIKSLLTDSNLCGYIDDNIRLLYNETATKEKILENLTWLKQQAENDPEATILIYYSGHGLLDKSGDYYLIPHETDRADIPETALPAEIFNQALQAIPAQRLLVIIDSCHAQGMATSKDDTKNKRSPIPKGFTQSSLPKTIVEDLKGSGRVVFTSSTGTQLSWIRSDGEMSIYTYHFLEALQGAGNQPGDKLVKVSHLMNYLSETVPMTVQKEYNKEQTPFFDFATEDFPVSLLRGGKGLPEAGYESVEAEAQEKIRNISNQVNDGVGNVGDGNIGLKIDSGGGSITIGDVSSG